MAQITMWPAIAFMALLAIATGVYADCRVAGGTPEACRVIFRNTGEFVKQEMPKP
jgi:hypothetical protein